MLYERLDRLEERAALKRQGDAGYLELNLWRLRFGSLLFVAEVLTMRTLEPEEMKEVNGGLLSIGVAIVVVASVDLGKLLCHDPCDPKECKD